VSGIDYVDMRFEERVYVRPAARDTAAPKASGPRAKGQGAKS
jgi:hypothetical protein